MMRTKRILLFSVIALIMSLGLIVPIDSLTNDFKASGDVIILKINLKNAYVREVKCADGHLEQGDFILKIDNKIANIATIENFEKGKKNIDIDLLRNNSVTTISMNATELKNYEFDNNPMFVGTITAVDGENNFIGLSHGITSYGNEINKNMTRSIEVYDADNVYYKPNEKKELGYINCKLSDNKIGEVSNINECGIYGKLNKQFISDNNLNLDTSVDSVKAKPGKAYVLLTNPKTNKIEKYDCLILGTNVNGHFKIRLVDKHINKYSNGIVQGMSGSPIVQDGKLIGGVCSVTRSNTKNGYGTDIFSMINISNK